MRIVKDPDERKQEILDAAIRVFARNGYEKTSISDIAKEINVSQGLCYRYFPSKEDIYDAAIDEYAEYIVTQNINKSHAGNRTLRDEIELLRDKYGMYTSTEHGNKDLYELFHKEGSHKLHDQLFLKVGEKLVPYVEKELLSAVARGEVQIADVKSIAYFAVYGQIGILKAKDIPDKDKMAQICAYLLKLVGLDS